MGLDPVDQITPLDSDHPAPHEWASLDEAAAYFGVSVKTLRRRIQKGQIPARRVEIPGGFTYRVQLSPYTGQPPTSPLDRLTIPSDYGDSHVGQGVDQSLVEAFRSLVDQLQQERAQLHRENLELAGRCGWLQSENRQLAGRVQDLEQELRLLKAPAAAAADMPTDQAPAEMTNHPAHVENGPDSGVQKDPRRPWWRRAVSWLGQSV